MTNRVFLIVLDSFGIGEMPDAYKWNDEGSNTLGAVRNHPAFACPTMEKLGLFHIDGVSDPADLAGKPLLDEDSLLEALQYRAQEKLDG